MSSRKQVVSAGVAGLILAVALIAGMAYFLPVPTKTVTSSQASSSTQGPSSQQSSSQSSSGQPAESQGTIDVLLTDPPNVPTDVSAVYVTYSNVAVHVSSADNQSGSTNSNTTGTIDLMKMVNISTTIASIKVATGVYNALRFNVSSAAVTFNGKNYTAFVPRALLTVPIPGGVRVNATTSNAEIIDMSPTVLNIGSGSTPEFIINTAASCFRVPPNAVTKDLDHVRFSFDLIDMAWWHQVRESYTANVTASGASLSASSLSVTVKNTGSTPLNLSAIFVTPLGNECAQTSASGGTSSTATTPSYYGGQNGGPKDHGRVPDCLTGSATFFVENNGTLLSVKGLLPGASTFLGKASSSPWSLLGSIGLTVAAGGSVTLTYSGPISFGFAPFGRTLPGVISGDQYDVTVVGLQALAQIVVVAS